MKPKYPKFAEDLRIWRKEAGVTQKELSEKTGISLSSITKYETGERHPREEQLDKIFDALGLEKTNVVINLVEGVNDITEEDLIYIKEEIDRILENLSPKFAKKLYEYTLDLQLLDRIDRFRRE